MAESAAPKSYKKTKKNKKLKNHPKPNASQKSSKNLVNYLFGAFDQIRNFIKSLKIIFVPVFETNVTHFFVFQLFTSTREPPGGV